MTLRRAVGDRTPRGVDRRGGARSPRAASSTAKVGMGSAVGSEMRSRQRQEGHGRADQARRHRHADPGRRLHDDRQGREGVLRLRQRQRRHPRPADQVHPLQRAAEPGAGGRARAEADRERQGRRHRRQHELRRVRDELEVLQEQGLHRHRRRRPGRVLQHAVVRRVEHGPALQQRRRRAGADRGRRQEDRDRLAGDDLRVRGRRRRQARRSRRASRSRSSRRTCRSPTRPRSCSRCTSSPATAAGSSSTSRPTRPRRS